MASEVFQTPVQFVKANRKKDRSVSLQFITSFEVTTEDFAEYDRKLNSEGWLLFKQNKEFDYSELPKENTETDTKKPSIRLRDVLFVFWKQQTEKGNTQTDFETFYKTNMEKFIELVKSKLE